MRHVHVHVHVDRDDERIIRRINRLENTMADEFAGVDEGISGVQAAVDALVARYDAGVTEVQAAFDAYVAAEAGEDAAELAAAQAAIDKLAAIKAEVESIGTPPPPPVEPPVE